MHSLLRSAYFASWPLRVRFFCADVYRVWRLWDERVDTSLPRSKVILDGDCPKLDNEDDAVGSIQALSVDCTPLGEYLDKSMFMLDDAQDLHCALCKAPLAPDIQQVVVCPRPLCRGATHLLCLSTKFLEDSGQTDSLVPTEGACPTCKEIVLWAVMMRELTLRNRADKEVRKILRKRERRQRKDAAESSTKQSTKIVTGSAPVPTTDISSTSPSKSTHRPSYALENDDPQLDDEWLEAVALESDTEFGRGQKGQSPQPSSRLEMVIEDSEWDDAEIVE